VLAVAWALTSPRRHSPLVTRSLPVVATLTQWPRRIDDYVAKTKQTITAWSGLSGLQGGDPAKLAKALIQLASEEQPPRRFIAGADAIAAAEQKVKDLQEQIDAYRELSTSLAIKENRTGMHEVE